MKEGIARHLWQELMYRPLWRISLTLSNLLLIALAASNSRAQTIFQETFESYAIGGNLDGQGGWTGYNGTVPGGADPVLIDSGTPLPTRFLNGHNSTTGTESEFVHPLSRSLDSSQVTTLTFDAYSWSNSHNSWVGFYANNNPASPVLYWEADERLPGNMDGWFFGAHQATGNNSNLVPVPGLINQITHFGIVVDGTNDTVYGTYDVGMGIQQTQAFSFTASQIASIQGITIGMDHRFGPQFTGAAFDNISVQVPEPGALALLAGLGVAGGLFAVRRLRRHKK